jgi:hypothetical protein
LKAQCSNDVADCATYIDSFFVGWAKRSAPTTSEGVGTARRRAFAHPSLIALDLGVPSGRITDILNGRRSITADTAMRLGRHFGNRAVPARSAKLARHCGGLTRAGQGHRAAGAVGGRGVTALNPFYGLNLLGI